MTEKPAKRYPHKLKPGCHNFNLLNLQDDTKEALRADATDKGQTLQEYVRRLLNAKADELRSK